MVTVQVVEPEAASELLPHCREVTRGDAVRERLAVALTPLKVAVTVAD
jgi:hypothetical protein